MTWFWLVIAYVLCLIIADLINKVSVNDDKIDEVIFGACVNLGTGLIALVISLFLGFSFVFTIVSISLFLVMSITYVVAVSAFFTGLKKIDISEVAIIQSLGTIFSLLLGILVLSEALTLPKVFGAFFILSASLLISFKSKKLTINKYSLLILASAFFYALGAVWDKKLNAFGNPISYIALSFCFVGGAILVVFLKRTKKVLPKMLVNPKFRLGIGVNSVLYTAAFVSLFEAYNRGAEVSRTYPITLSSYILVPVLGIVLLKEKENWKRKLIAVCLVILGLWQLGR